MFPGLFRFSHRDFNIGSWYSTGFKWPHDGNPYESANFIVCSDGASLEARQFAEQSGFDAVMALYESGIWTASLDKDF